MIHVGKSFLTLPVPYTNFSITTNVAQKYDGACLKRLLEIRWTSHYDVTRCIIENEDILLRILSNIAEDDFATTDLCTEAAGLLIQIKRHNFFETGIFLGVLKPASPVSDSGHVQSW